MTVLDRPRVAPARPDVRATGWGATLLLAVVAGLLRVPFVGRPLTPDEGGYLVVASQWHRGGSTYGAYFLDRPPLLVALFELADALGGGTALRLIGIAAVVVSVLLAGAIGGRWAAAAAAAFLSTPLFGTTSVDGELLAVPFVLAGVLLVLRSLRAPTVRAGRTAAAGAGACAGLALLVKQNMLDVVVLAVVLLIATALGDRRRATVRHAVGLAVAFAVAVVVVVGVALIAAAARGTTPADLVDALVTFRAQAAATIDAHAGAPTAHRFHRTVLALVASGAPLVALAALTRVRRRPSDRRLLVGGVALVAWELTGAALGGSYWHHYLVALVPGLVVLVAATETHAESARVVRCAVVAAAASTALAWTAWAVHPAGPGEDQRVAAYVRDHARPGDTMVVAFGHPDIVRGAGLSSPYPHLWSLSVRVRDPDLRALTSVLDGRAAPRWVVVDGASLATWGVDATRGDQALARHYLPVASLGDWHVLEHGR